MDRWDDNLIETAPVGFVLLDATGMVTRVNETFVAWTGWRLDDVVGKRTWQDLLAVGDRIFWGTHCAPLVALQGTVMELSMSIRRADGGRLPAVVNVQARCRGDEPFVLLTVFDATDRSGYERELRATRDEARRGAERLRALGAFTASLIATPSAEVVAQRVCDAAVDVLGARRASLWRALDGELVPTSVGPGPTLSPVCRIADHPVAAVARRGGAIAVVATEEIESGTSASRHALAPDALAVTLEDDGGMYGVLVVVPNATGPDIDCALVQTMAAQAAHALAAAATAEEDGLRLVTARQQAMTDALTGIPNRRAFTERLHALASQPADAGPTVLAIIDIDHFKAVNDMHGHDVGDHVLVAVAERLCSAMPLGAFLGRLGGEEFVALWAPVDEHALLGEALLTAVSETPIACPGTEPIHVTVSMGIATIRSSDEADSALRDADLALYRAKRDGRNCIRGEAAPSAVAAGSRRAAG